MFIIYIVYIYIYIYVCYIYYIYNICMYICIYNNNVTCVNNAITSTRTILSKQDNMTSASADSKFNVWKSNF